MKLLAILCIRDETILQCIYIDILQYLLASHTVIQQLPYGFIVHFNVPAIQYDIIILILQGEFDSI